MTETASESRLVSIVIPVYDSPELDTLTTRIEDVLAAAGERYEIVFVDDGSRDARIWPALERLSRDRPRVRAVQLTRNFGQQAATLCGLREARGDVVITMDDDLQFDPGDIPALLAHGDHDIAIGQLVQREHHLFRRMASAAKGVFDRIVIGKPKGLRLSSFRLLSRTVVDGVLAMRTPNPFLPALMFHVSKDVIGVPVRHSRRFSGRSGYTLRKLIGMFGNLVLNNSSILLRVAALTGIFFALVSFALAGIVIYRKLVYHTSVQGWTSLFAATMLIGGLLLVSVGIIGEYLIRIIESSEAKPTYFVRRRSQ
jgi:dolichol-phosphate mannosyltransferase/undecaprenyl-phosphate 4-deoxy-4-formamido-L-arabinose transferase